MGRELSYEDRKMLEWLYPDIVIHRLNYPDHSVTCSCGRYFDSNMNIPELDFLSITKALTNLDYGISLEKTIDKKKYWAEIYVNDRDTEGEVIDSITSTSETMGEALHLAIKKLMDKNPKLMKGKQNEPNL